MKKFIALLLALLMTFSVATVAFAAEETAPETETETTEEIDLGEYQWILDLPLWTLKPGLKIAKIALKFVKVYLKLSAVINNVPDEVVDGVEKAITEMIEKSQQAETAAA